MITYLDVILIDETTLKNNSAIDSNITWKTIAPVAKIVQDMYLQPVLGSNLFDKLKQMTFDYRTTGTTIPPDYKYLIDNMIKDILIYGIQSDLLLVINDKLKAKGVVKNTDANVINESYENIQYLRQTMLDKMNFYKDYLAKYLCHNASKYVEYTTISNLYDVLPEKDNRLGHSPINFKYKKQRLY